MKNFCIACIEKPTIPATCMDVNDQRQHRRARNRRLSNMCVVAVHRDCFRPSRILSVWNGRSIAVHVYLLVLLCNTRVGSNHRGGPSQSGAPNSFATVPAYESFACFRSVTCDCTPKVVGPSACACRAPTSRHSSSSPMVAGLCGRRESTHCAGAKPQCRVISLAFKHSLRIMSIASLPEACVSMMTFDIIFLSAAPRRSTLPICSGAFNPAGLIATPFLARVEPNTPLLCVLGSQRTSLGQLVQRVQPCTKARRHACDDGEPKFSTLSQSMLDHTWFPYKQHSGLRSACQLSRRSRTHQLPLRD